MKKILFCLCIFSGFLSHAQSGGAGTLDCSSAEVIENAISAKSELESAIQTLQAIHLNEGMVFKNDTSKEYFKEALAKLEVASNLMEQVKAAGSTAGTLNAKIEEAIALQNLLGAYLGVKTLHGYKLKQGEISFEIDAGFSDAFDRVTRKFPFLRRNGVNSRVRINPGESIVTQFNQLKTEFRSAIVDTIYYASSDDFRIRQLIEWGSETSVIYPNTNFGKDILEAGDVFDFKLELAKKAQHKK